METNLRKEYQVPFSDERIAQLRERIREIVMEDWPNIVFSAYRDSFAHVAESEEFHGRVPEYIQEELEAKRVACLRAKLPMGFLPA